MSLGVPGSCVMNRQRAIDARQTQELADAPHPSR
jgi:hypothetical protein